MVMLVKLPSLVGLLLRVSMTGSKDSGSMSMLLTSVVAVVAAVVETFALCKPRTCHIGISGSADGVAVTEGGGDAGVGSGSEAFCATGVVVELQELTKLFCKLAKFS